ncbi:DUF3853 family protein [Phocaeicola plebeius]|uniref:DUF3853 family protein n=1 Tax=Phocaeicola plebeius TaxID=310297 RepID=UPI002941DD8C|nr:DUF3853 family protein [Phocaeicola plebeius]
MENKKNEALLSKAVFSMNGAELLELLRQVTESEVKEDKFHSLPNDYPNLQPFVTGIKGIASLLGISVSTVSRMKADGLLDDATFQNGKTVIFDTYKVLEILRVSNKKNKFNRKL